MSATTYVQKPELALVSILGGLSERHGKTYCYPSQDWLCEHLARFAGHHMSRRTLNRHLHALEKFGWIKRLRRHRRQAERGFEFRSTLYILTRRAFRWLSMFARVAARAVKWGRVTIPAQYIPFRDSNTAAGPSGPARQEIRKPPDGGGDTKQTTATASDALQTLKRMLKHGRR